MSEHLVPLKKETGGCTLTHDDVEYAWKKDGDVVDVPYDWALELLAIKGAGFSVADEKAAQKAADQATAEAATQAPDEPQREAAVPPPGLESRAPEGLDLPEAQEQIPARPVAKAAEGSQAPESGHASPITPRPRGGTRTGNGKK